MQGGTTQHGAIGDSGLGLRDPPDLAGLCVDVVGGPQPGAVWVLTFEILPAREGPLPVELREGGLGSALCALPKPPMARTMK